MPTLTLAQARRIAVAAQGFGDPRPEPFGATARHLRRVIDRVQVIQIDSVNVLARSHYLPFYSRLGPYDIAGLDRLRDGPGRAGRPRELVEYVVHEASLIPPESWPLLGARMRAGWGPEGAAWAERVDREHHGLLDRVLQVVGAHGPLTSREAEAVLQHERPRGRESWGWNWSVVKECVEFLFRTGKVTSAGRTTSFERRYALPESVLPDEVAARGPWGDTPLDPEEAAVEMVRRSARAHGIGSLLCLRDYFRLPATVAQPAIDHLVGVGELEPVTVRGWDRPAYLDLTARRPRRAQGTALLSPFDSLIWQRDRTFDLFGFHYRLEIYVPADKRVYGYYVLPFLLDGELVGRVDLKADRARSELVVRAVHLEAEAPSGARAALGTELRSMADWLGLETVTFS